MLYLWEGRQHSQTRRRTKQIKNKTHEMIRATSTSGTPTSRSMKVIRKEMVSPVPTTPAMTLVLHLTILSHLVQDRSVTARMPRTTVSMMEQPDRMRHRWRLSKAPGPDRHKRNQCQHNRQREATHAPLEIAGLQGQTRKLLNSNSLAK